MLHGPLASFCFRIIFFFFSSRRRHTRFDCDWSSEVCSSDLDRSKVTCSFSVRLTVCTTLPSIRFRTPSGLMTWPQSAPSDDRVQLSGLDGADHVVAELWPQHRGVDRVAAALQRGVARVTRRATRQTEHRQRNEHKASHRHRCLPERGPSVLWRVVGAPASHERSAYPPKPASLGIASATTRGRVIFPSPFNARLAGLAPRCRNCYSLGGEGGRRGPALDGVATRLTRHQLIRQVLQKSPPAAACSFDRDRYLTMPSAAFGSLSIISAVTPKLSSSSRAGFEASHCESEISS